VDPRLDRARWLHSAVALVVLGIVALVPPFTTPTSTLRLSAALATEPAPSPPSPSLAIQTPLVAPEGVSAAPLRAVWSPPPSGCTVGPSWYAWSLPSPSAAGVVFESPYSANTLFASAALVPEVSEVAVRSELELGCAEGNRTVQSSAYANVTTYPPLSLTALSVDPSASPAPGRVELRVAFEGGRPAYLVGVAWGDGAVANATEEENGSFSFSHTFGPGSFTPRVAVLDENRVDVRATVAEPVEVGNGTVLAIRASPPLAEVGERVRFHGTVLHMGPRWGIGIGCTPDLVVPPQTFVTTVTCVPTKAGVLGVTFEVAEPVPSEDVEVTREQPVVPAVHLDITPWDPSVDAGTPTYLNVTIGGGIPPFRVSLGCSQGVLANALEAPGDGTFLVPWTPAAPGVAPLWGTVTDALGASFDLNGTRALVSPPPKLTVTAVTFVTPSSTQVDLRAVVSGGSGPYRWVAGVAPAAPNGTSLLGDNGSSTFDWKGVYVEEGPASVDLEVEDDAGVVEEENLTLELPALPTLVVTPILSPSAGSVNLLVRPAGGVLPFALWVNSSAGVLWNGTEATPGPYLLRVPVPTPGPANLSVGLEDARSEAAVAWVSTSAWSNAVPTPPPGGPRAPDLLPWAAAGGLAAAGGAVCLRLRRRLRPPPVERPPPDPEEVLERILRPAEGADRLTVELMAEEEGVPLDEVRATIDRLVREEKIRAGTDPDGSEVLAWWEP
jgi:hypothetical protein